MGRVLSIPYKNGFFWHGLGVLLAYLWTYLYIPHMKPKDRVPFRDQTIAAVWVLETILSVGQQGPIARAMRQSSTFFATSPRTMSSFLQADASSQLGEPGAATAAKTPSEWWLMANGWSWLPLVMYGHGWKRWTSHAFPMNLRMNFRRRRRWGRLGHGSPHGSRTLHRQMAEWNFGTGALGSDVSAQGLQESYLYRCGKVVASGCY